MHGLSINWVSRKECTLCLLSNIHGAIGEADIKHTQLYNDKLTNDRNEKYFTWGESASKGFDLVLEVRGRGEFTWGSICDLSSARPDGVTPQREEENRGNSSVRMSGEGTWEYSRIE